MEIPPATTFLFCTENYMYSTLLETQSNRMIFQVKLRLTKCYHVRWIHQWHVRS